MVRNKILFICGSLNQAKIMCEISRHLESHHCYFTPGTLKSFARYKSMTAIPANSLSENKFRRIILEYLSFQNLRIDISGENENYDLVFTCSDSGVPKNIKCEQVIFVQEGIHAKRNYLYDYVKQYSFTSLMAGKSKVKTNHVYSKFCVASEGYKQHFIDKGIDTERIVVTGLPDFDNLAKYHNNDFPYSGYVLAVTSDSRENYNFENRQRFIHKAVELAADRKLIFKLHPNENYDREIWEINNYAPGSLIFTNGETGEMIANCDLLITKITSAAFIGLALNKKVYSENNLEQLKRLMPVQNGGSSAMNVALLAEKLIGEKKSAPVYYFPSFKSNKLNFIQRYKLNQKLPTESV